MLAIKRIVLFMLVLTAVSCGKKTVTPTPVEPITPATKGYA